MIVRRGLDLARLLRHLGPKLGILLAYDIIVTVLYVRLGWRWLSIDDLPLPLAGSALALIITFRNNAAYARWWEARALWGAIVNNTRNLTRGLTAMLPDPARNGPLTRHMIAYALALRCHLLRRPPWDDIAAYLPEGTLQELRAMANVPWGIQLNIARMLGAAELGTPALAAFDRTLSALADAQGGLERIKNTPLPRQYMQFPLVFTRVYCVLLPLGLLSDLGVLTPVGSTLIGFMFLALDRIGRDLEDPFEGTLYDVPMQAIARTIEIDLLQAAGERDVPSPVLPVNGVLA